LGEVLGFLFKIPLLIIRGLFPFTVIEITSNLGGLINDMPHQRFSGDIDLYFHVTWFQKLLEDNRLLPKHVGTSIYE
jgi:hypothetical protein